MRSDKGHAKSPEAHYGTMSVELAIKALPVNQLAGPELPYLPCGRRWPHLPQALEVMAAGL